MNGPVLHVSARTLRANLDVVRERIAPSALMIVLKDDAYGHGLEWVGGLAARTGVSWLGSYDIPAGVALRRIIGTEPRIFAWVTSVVEEIEAAILADIDLGVGTAEYLRLVCEAAARLGRVARVHLKIDTGLHRNGIRSEDWADVVRDTRAAERAQLVRLVGVWSHLAEASDAEDDDAHRCFLGAVEIVRSTGAEPEVVHLTASAAAWWRPELRGTLSRIGAFCFGIRSAEGPELAGLRPVAALSAPVIDVRGDEVVVGIGSFDGLPSSLRGLPVGTPDGVRGLVEIGETSSRVTSWPGAAPGQDIWVFGPGDHGEQSATTLAERIDTVGEEILTRLSPRVPRVVEDRGRDRSDGLDETRGLIVP